MKFQASEEWLRKMAEAEDGCNVNIGCAEQIMAEAIIKHLTEEVARLTTTYNQLASDYEYDKRTEELNDRYEKALQSIINYQSLCYNTGLGGRCLECPTCTARKALGDKEDDITVRLGRGEDPRGF